MPFIPASTPCEFSGLIKWNCWLRIVNLPRFCKEKLPWKIRTRTHVHKMEMSTRFAQEFAPPLLWAKIKPSPSHILWKGLRIRRRIKFHGDSAVYLGSSHKLSCADYITLSCPTVRGQWEPHSSSSIFKVSNTSPRATLITWRQVESCRDNHEPLLSMTKRCVQSWPRSQWHAWSPRAKVWHLGQPVLPSHINRINPPPPRCPPRPIIQQSPVSDANFGSHRRWVDVHGEESEETALSCFGRFNFNHFSTLDNLSGHQELARSIFLIFFNPHWHKTFFKNSVQFPYPPCISSPRKDLSNQLLWAIHSLLHKLAWHWRKGSSSPSSPPTSLLWASAQKLARTHTAWQTCWKGGGGKKGGVLE